MCDSFNDVELDIKLEQSIQRASKSQTLMFAVVAEFELISHEILIIQNNCRKLTDERMMEHHKTIIYQELRSITAVIFDGIVFIIKASGVRLHNFATEHLINAEVMDVFENGEKIQTRELVLKTKKLAVTIHRCNLPKCDTFGN